MKKDEIVVSVRNILHAIGENREEIIEETPIRVGDMFEELISVERKPPKLKTFENEGYDEIITKNNTPFFSLCEHHFLPFVGICHVAYLPKDKLIGFSKIARTIEYFSKRLQLQERLTHQIAEYLNEGIKPKGLMVVIEAMHLCEQMRGAKSSGEMVTSAVYGEFREKKKARDEAMSLMGMKK